MKNSKNNKQLWEIKKDIRYWENKIKALKAKGNNQLTSVEKLDLRSYYALASECYIELNEKRNQLSKKRKIRKEKINEFIKLNNLKPDNYGMDYCSIEELIYESIGTTWENATEEQMEKVKDIMWEVEYDMNHYLGYINFKHDIKINIEQYGLTIKHKTLKNIPNHPLAKVSKMNVLNETAKYIQKELKEQFQTKITLEKIRNVLKGYFY